VIYASVLPAAQHRAIRHMARKTKHIERPHRTLPRRGARRVREAWSFSSHSPSIAMPPHGASATITWREPWH